MTETVQVLMEQPVEVRVETTDEITRTLTLEFSAGAGQGPAEVYEDAFLLAFVAEEIALPLLAAITES